MKSLYLIGFRGSGKTTFGRELAKRKQMQFLDLDESFETKHKKKIVDYVDEYGLQEFRAAELELLRETDAALRLMDAKDTVIATGGGLVEIDLARQILWESPFPKIYLELDADGLWNRLKNSPERKKIGDLNGFEVLQSLLEKRRPYYEKIATFRLWNQDISGALDALEQHWDRLWQADK
jgi:shikimate kinase